MRKSKDSDDSGISTPFNLKKSVSVTPELNWEVESTDEVFEIKEQIGKGGYGSVYKAELKSSGFTIAVKKVFDDQNAKVTIKKEVDILKKCNNPFIVNYFGCVLAKGEGKKDAKGMFHYPDETKQPVWILMDFCAGGSLRDYLDNTKKNLTEPQIAAVLAGVLQGLTYLHANSIIHRDLKCGNILLTENGSIKIADFGISTQLSAAATGKAQTLIGSTYWMAPEILAENYNNRIDLWSLGITAIEMAEGEPPNFSLKPFQLMLKLPTAESPKLKNSQNFSKEFVDFLSLCLQKDPKKRPEAKQLVQHPFILKNTNNIANVLQQLAKEAKQRKV